MRYNPTTDIAELLKTGLKKAKKIEKEQAQLRDQLTKLRLKMTELNETELQTLHRTIIEPITADIDRLETSLIFWRDDEAVIRWALKAIEVNVAKIEDELEENRREQERLNTLLERAKAARTA